MTTGACQHTLTGHASFVRSIVYLPDGSQIASTSHGDKTFRLWNPISGECLHTPSGHDRRVTSIAFSPLGDLLASASDDCTMRMWDLETGKCRHTSIGHTKGVLVVVYSPQGSQVASGSEDRSVIIWDARTGECLHTLTGHTGGVDIVVYSSSGDQIVSGDNDATARLWDVTSGQCRAVIPSMGTDIRSIAWSMTSDDKCFAVGYGDGCVRMWQVIENDNRCHIRLRWRTVNGKLVSKGTLIRDVHGLSRLNKELLNQQGAVGHPFSEAYKKMQATLIPFFECIIWLVCKLFIIVLHLYGHNPSTYMQTQPYCKDIKTW